MEQKIFCAKKLHISIENCSPYSKVLFEFFNIIIASIIGKEDFIIGSTLSSLENAITKFKKIIYIVQ
jgi:hypothetical protein